MALDFTIRGWHADFNPADGPAPRQVPKSLLRRLSPLARRAFRAIDGCIAPGEALPAVFSSSHGQIADSLALLQTLQAGEELSPAGFSLSVHNAIAGLYSMVYAHRLETVALAPGAGGAGPGFIEALGLLGEGHQEVLLVFYDEALPDFYPTTGYRLSAPGAALALRLARGGAGLVCRFERLAEPRGDGEQPLQLPALVEFLFDTRAELRLGNNGQGWLWQKR